jgi:serine protease Do
MVDAGMTRPPLNKLRVSVATAAALMGFALAGCNGSFADNNPVEAAASSPPPAIATASRNVAAALPDFASLVEHYGAAVVNVTVVGKAEQVADMPGMSPNDPLNEFFRRFGQPMPRGNPMPSRGEGSGFIVTSDGYVLTNAHVVADAQEVTVKTTDRREYTAKVVGSDEGSDVAVLKIDAKNLPTVKIGDPSKLRPGEWVIAIGSPFGFENSVTAGIVSATSRPMPGSNYAAPFIQTDVAVNPGNSGGPLFNLNGEVVGINSQIYSRNGGYMGLSFAIPIDTANNVRQQLVSTGRVTRSRIGVSIQDVNAQLAESFGLDRPHGALVGMVEDDGPGAKAGIKAGDVILKVDGTEVETSQQLPTLIASKKPGSTVNIEVWRDGGTKRLTAKPVEVVEKGTKVALRDDQQADETAKLGLTVRPLEQQEKRQVETEGDLVVESADGPAAAAGVQRGDIILGVNGKAVKSLEELKTAARKTKGKIVALLIERDSAQIFVPVRVG